MKKTLMLSAVLLALAAMTSCGNKNDYKELIVGKWEVKTSYHWYHDLTDESLSSEATYTLPDTNYIGYDSAEFHADGTMQWHMSDRYVSEGMFTDPYRNFDWLINGDSLFVYIGTIENGSKYAIKALDNKTLIIEEYTNNEHPEYSHHHWEQIHRYTLNRQ